MNITENQWERYLFREIKRMNAKYSSFRRGIMDEFDLAEGFHIGFTFKGRHVTLSFVKRSGVAFLIIDNMWIEEFFTEKHLLRSLHTARFKKFLVQSLRVYASLVSASSMMLSFEVRTHLSFEKQGFRSANELKNASFLIESTFLGNKLWYCDQLPHFTEAFANAYRLFLKTAADYEDKTLYLEKERIADSRGKAGYVLEYAGLSSFLELVYNGDYEWSYICHNEEQQTAFPIEKREEILLAIQRKQRLINLYTPPTFHFVRFFNRMNLFYIHEETVYQAFKQDHCDEELEVLFATRGEEIVKSVNLLVEVGDYHFYKIWDYYVAGRKGQPFHSFFANSLDELKKQVKTFEKDYLHREFLDKVTIFDHQLNFVT